MSTLNKIAQLLYRNNKSFYDYYDTKNLLIMPFYFSSQTTFWLYPYDQINLIIKSIEVIIPYFVCEQSISQEVIKNGDRKDGMLLALHFLMKSDKYYINIVAYIKVCTQYWYGGTK